MPAGMRLTMASGWLARKAREALGVAGEVGPVVPQMLAGLACEMRQAAVRGGGRHARVYPLEVQLLRVGGKVVGDVPRGSPGGPRRLGLWAASWKGARLPLYSSCCLGLSWPWKGLA